jgi:hypothetical protein
MKDMFDFATSCFVYFVVPWSCCAIAVLLHAVRSTCVCVCMCIFVIAGKHVLLSFNSFKLFVQWRLFRPDYLIAIWPFTCALCLLRNDVSYRVRDLWTPNWATVLLAFMDRLAWVLGSFPVCGSLVAVAAYNFWFPADVTAYSLACLLALVLCVFDRTTGNKLGPERWNRIPSGSMLEGYGIWSWKEIPGVNVT